MRQSRSQTTPQVTAESQLKVVSLSHQCPSLRSLLGPLLFHITHVEMEAQCPQDSMLQLPAYAPVMLYQPLVLLHLYLTAVLQHGIQALSQSISSKRRKPSESLTVPPAYSTPSATLRVQFGWTTVPTLHKGYHHLLLHEAHSCLSTCFSKLLSTLCNQPTTRRANNHG